MSGTHMENKQDEEPIPSDSWKDKFLQEISENAGI
jgi:hypothetical protein